jgi:hypothetical protein
MKNIIYISLFFLTISLSAQQHYKTRRLPFNNSESSEMAPVIYKNGIVFSSDKKNAVLVVTTDQLNNYPYNLYFIEKKGKKWGSPTLLSPSLTSRLSESSASFSIDFATMFITRSQLATASLSQMQRADTIRLGIYECSPSGKDWKISKAFYFNDAEYDIAFPSLSADKQYLYFSSKDPSGYGGYDIYVSEKRGASWSDPENLGIIINTPENEVFPFMHESGRLYFSSRGHEGQGNLDIFYTEKRNGEWIEPINLPYPFNTRADDFGFVQTAKMDTGYFVTNKRGSDDIYMFTSAFPVFSECPFQVDEDFCYFFSETGSLDLDTTSLKYEWDFGDGNKVRNIEAEHCYSNVGQYLVSLNVIDTLTGDVYFSEATYDLLIEPLEQSYITSIDTVSVNERFRLDGRKSEVRSFKAKEYFWDFSDGNIETGIEVSHTFTRAGEYFVRLGITDGQGEDEADDQSELGRVCAQKKIIVTE